MNMSAVLIISVAAAIILIVGGGLVIYMAGLVKNAYELKVQLNTAMDERLTKMADELDKKSRWIKRDLLEELDKIKTAVETDNARKFEALGEPLLKRIGEVEQSLRKAIDDWTKEAASEREAMTKLDARLGALRKDVRQVEPASAAAAAAAGAPPAPSSAASEPGAADIAALAAKMVENPAAMAAQAAGMVKPAAPPRPAQAAGAAKRT